MPRRLLLLLAAITALGSLATHAVVPALPDIATDLRASQATTQLLVTVYVIALGLGQLVGGPLADRIGRRPVILVGALAFTIASALAVLTPTLGGLIAARILQGLGASACLVSGRAFVADDASGAAATSRLASMMLIMLISPALAPLVGGALAVAAGWRWIFGALAIAGALAGLLTALWLVERARPSRSEGLWPDVMRLARNPRFLRYTLVIAFTSAAIQTFFSAIPFVLDRAYRLGPPQIALCFSAMAVASALGTLLVRRARDRFSVLRASGFAIVAAGIAFVVLGALELRGLLPTIGVMTLLGAGAGGALPVALAEALQAEQGIAGTAASLAGAAQMIIAGAVASSLALAHLDTLALIGLAVAGLGLIASCAAPRSAPSPRRRAAF